MEESIVHTTVEVIYKGKRINEDAYVSVETHLSDGSVTVEELDLEPSLQVRNHSPTGFEWGYGGSGPAQLALGILMHFCETGVGTDLAEVIALKFYRQFTSQFVQNWHKDTFEMNGVAIQEWIDGQ